MHSMKNNLDDSGRGKKKEKSIRQIGMAFLHKKATLLSGFFN